MDVLCEDELGLILKRVSDPDDRKFVAQVCNQWWRMEALSRSSIRVLESSILHKLLARFPNLVKFETSLSMSDDDLIFVAKTCPNLEVINLGTSDFFPCDFGEVGLCALASACPNLSKIVLSGRISGTRKMSDIGVVRLITSAAKLTHLDLERCPWVTSDRIVETIGSSSCSKTIKTLILADVEHSDHKLSSLQNMCGLQELNLKRCRQIEDRALQFLGNGFCIKKLDLSCTRISDDGVSRLQTMCALEELNLAWCRNITDRALQCLSNGSVSKTIKKLILSHCYQITDSGVSLLRNMCVLEELNLGGCHRITDRGLKYLTDGSCSRIMKKMVLERCSRISDVGVMALAQSCRMDVTFSPLPSF